jgi:hypothetical protein
MTRDEALAEMRDWGRRNKALEAERDPVILRAWLAGAKVAHIAAAMGISRPTVYKATGESRRDGDPRDADRCEVRRVDDKGTTYELTAWHGPAEILSIAGMSHRDAVAFLVETLGVDEAAAETGVDSAQQSMRPYRVF